MKCNCTSKKINWRKKMPKIEGIFRISDTYNYDFNDASKGMKEWASMLIGGGCSLGFGCFLHKDVKVTGELKFTDKDLKEFIR